MVNPEPGNQTPVPHKDETATSQLNEQAIIDRLKFNQTLNAAREGKIIEDPVTRAAED